MRLKIFALLAVLIPLSAQALLDTLTVSGNPAPMTINTATAGNQPNSVSNNSTSYSILTLLGGRRITGQLNVNMPANTTLRVQLQAPPLGAVSQGLVTMTTSPANLVTNIGILALTTGLTITYQLSATVAATPVNNSTVTLTLTLL